MFGDTVAGAAVEEPLLLIDRAVAARLRSCGRSLKHRTGRQRLRNGAFEERYLYHHIKIRLNQN